MYDYLPKKWCCEQSDMCELYYAVDPQPKCSSVYPTRGYLFGDPHIITFDQLTYTFNGLGEFKILELDWSINVYSIQFKLQGRTCRAVSSDGISTNATVWCGFVLASWSNTLRVEISKTNDLVIYANGQDYSLRFRDNANFNAFDSGFYLSKLQDSLKIITPEGIALTISTTDNMLELSIALDNMYRGIPRGLLGNFNGDKSDDFIWSNGIMSSTTSSGREIYEFGQSWAITSDVESLFVYEYGKSRSSYQDPSYTPLFLDEVDPILRQEAEAVCGSNDSVPCIFDYVATNSTLIASNTLAAASLFEQQTQSISNLAPVIHGNTQFQVTVNQTTLIEFFGEDPDNDRDHCELDKDGCASNPCLQESSCTDVEASVEELSGQSYICSVCPPGFHLAMNKLKCEDIDECAQVSNKCDNNATYIDECAERLHTCEQICINTAPFYTCECEPGFNKSGPLSNVCNKQNVEDLCANTQSQPCVYGCTNSSGTPQCFCQSGMKLAENGYACEDENESNLSLCSQGCLNTFGSYSCYCFMGYRISDQDKHRCETCLGNKYGENCTSTCECRGRATRCDNVNGCVCQDNWTGTFCDQDVDECLNSTSCRHDQLCVNTEGSFKCKCLDGYTDSNGIY
ncbi:mucin-like protein [Physella acuta]|uniref:mucin-like protein n=1 Tax=Physella acuta TaxID=109671 RepID=UPI0027DB108F|nr:mucin-like protein [Physella acuta]